MQFEDCRCLLRRPVPGHDELDAVTAAGGHHGRPAHASSRFRVTDFFAPRCRARAPVRSRASLSESASPSIGIIPARCTESPCRLASTV